MPTPAPVSAATRHPLLVVPVLALLWGLNWPAVKVALGEIAPWTLRSTGMGGAALLLFALAAWRGLPLQVRRGQWPRLILTGLLSVAAFNVLVAFAQLTGSTSRAAIVTYTMPIWALLLARLVLGERIDRRRAIALALGAGGLLLLAGPLLLSERLPAGVFYALGAGICWAAGTVSIKRFPIDVPPLVSTAWQLLIGALAAGSGMLVFEGLPVPKALSAAAGIALAFHIVLAIALGYFLWFEVVARLPAGIAALGTLVVPVVGVSSAMALLGERPSGFDLGGFALIIAAAGMALRSSATSASHAPTVASRRHKTQPLA